MKRNYKKCPICDREISVSNYNKHIKVCTGQKIEHSKEYIILDDGTCKCNYCDKIYTKKGIGSHIWRNHGEGINWTKGNDGFKNGTRTIWNKGLTKETSDVVKQYSENISKVMKDKVKSGTWKNTMLTEHARQLSSLRQTLHNTGGKAKWYKVDGISVQGTWERDFALKMNEFNIEWVRCNKKHILIYNKIKRYTPDFYIPIIDKIIEIKGYWWGDDKNKMRSVIKQNPSVVGRLKIIRKNKFERIMKCENREQFLLMI